MIFKTQKNLSFPTASKSGPFQENRIFRKESAGGGIFPIFSMKYCFKYYIPMKFSQIPQRAFDLEKRKAMPV